MPQFPPDESNNAAHSELPATTRENHIDISSFCADGHNAAPDVMRLWAETGYFHDHLR